jgi:myo-inositol-1(or 4)-monophosphatase
VSPAPPDFRAETRAAIAALRVALPLVQARTGAADVRVKGQGDFVIGTDLLVQSTVQRLLHEAHPEIAFLGEEDEPLSGVAGSPSAGVSASRGPTPSGSRVWLVDPICGTANFAAHIPLYAINIALVEDDVVTCAAVADGATGAIYVAERGQGAWSVSADALLPMRASPSTRLISVDPHGHGPGYLLDFGPVFAQHALVHPGWDVRVFSTTLALPYVASGRLAGAVYVNLGSPVHFAAGLLLAEAAGATVTDEHGAPWHPNNSIHVIAASAALHAELLTLVRAVIQRLIDDATARQAP